MGLLMGWEVIVASYSTHFFFFFPCKSWIFRISEPLSRQISVSDSGILLALRNSPPTKSKYLAIGSGESKKNFSEHSWDVDRAFKLIFLCPPPLRDPPPSARGGGRYSGRPYG